MDKAVKAARQAAAMKRAMEMTVAPSMPMTGKVRKPFRTRKSNNLPKTLIQPCAKVR